MSAVLGLEDAALSAGAGRPPLFRAVMAASQSMAAIAMPSSLVPCWMNLLVKSSRCWKVPLLVRRATPASRGQSGGVGPERPERSHP
jgi:hypothetical protein